LKPCIDAGNVIRLLRVPRPRRIEVQISARDGRLPIGRTRALRIRECDLPLDTPVRRYDRACRGQHEGALAKILVSADTLYRGAGRVGLHDEHDQGRIHQRGFENTRDVIVAKPVAQHQKECLWRAQNYKEEDNLAEKYAKVLDQAGYDLLRVQYHEHLTHLYVPSYLIFEKRNHLTLDELNAIEKTLDRRKDGPSAHRKRYVPRKKWRDHRDNFNVADLTIREVAEWMIEHIPQYLERHKGGFPLLPLVDGIDFDKKTFTVVE
jgi:hypothetical protein